MLAWIVDGSAPSPTGTIHPHARHLAARVGGAMLVTGGALGLVLLFLGPNFANGKVAPTLTSSAIAIPVGLACLIRPSVVPQWGLQVLAPFGTLLIATASLRAGSTADGSELLYIWPVLYTAYFMSIKVAFLNVAMIGSVYTPLSLWLLGPLGITPAVYLVGTSIVTAVIVANLRRQLNRLIAATELEARTDGLTGLANRRCWSEAVSREFARQARLGTSLSLVLIDIDHFKRLNDTHGHAPGTRR